MHMHCIRDKSRHKQEKKRMAEEERGEITEPHWVPSLE